MVRVSPLDGIPVSYYIHELPREIPTMACRSHEFHQVPSCACFYTVYWVKIGDNEIDHTTQIRSHPPGSLRQSGLFQSAMDDGW